LQIFMATNFQSVDDQLNKIKSTLQGISSNLSASTPEQRQQLSSAFTTLSGTLTSEQARRSVSNAQASAPGTTPNSTPTSTPDPMARALQEKAQAEARAKEAEARRKEAEATASIADQRLLGNKTNTGTSSAAGVDGAVPSAEETKKLQFQELMQREPMLAEYGLTEENLEDPMVIATLRNQVANTQQIQQNVQRLDEMVMRKEERVRQQVALIGQSVKNQEDQLKVEQRKRMAAEGMAGILSNRGLYSPEEHQGLIQEVVQDGILKLQEIQLEGFKLQNEMWQDFDDYEFEKYTAKSELLKEYNNLELATVTAIQERLQAVAKAEQEKLVFDQEQMDRASFVLAPELIGATPEQIREVAFSNGIDPGLLSREVEAYRQSQEMFDLDVQSKRESILSAQQSRILAQARFNRENQPTTEKSLTPSELKGFSDMYGLKSGLGDSAVNLIPSYWTRNDLDGFINKFPNAPKEDLPGLIKQYEDIVVASSITDDEERTKYLASVVEPAEVVVSDVTNRIRNDYANFFEAVKREGDSSKWDLRGKKGDVELWINKPSTQETIKQLADSGLTSYQVYNEIARMFASQPK
jgi:hypothetical protein